MHFWDTSYTIPPDAGFEHYHLGHLFWLAAWVGVCVLSAFTAKNQKSNRRRRVAVAVLLVLGELAKYAVTLAFGNFRLDFLPLHLCSINIFVILADLICEHFPRTQKALPYLREILYAVCLPGAAVALLFPGWGELPHANALCILSFVAHILLFLYPFLLLVSGFQPQFSRFLHVLPFVLAIVPVIYRLNLLWGTNFMFLRTAGLKNPLTPFEQALGSPAYLVGFVPLCAATWLLLYAAPKLIKRLHKR